MSRQTESSMISWQHSKIANIKLNHKKPIKVMRVQCENYLKFSRHHTIASRD